MAGCLSVALLFGLLAHHKPSETKWNESSFPLKADGETGRNGGVEAERFDSSFTNMNAFFGDALLVR